MQSTGNGKKEVTGANVLVAIFGEKDSHAVYYLHQQGVTRLDVVNFIAHGIKKSDPPEPTRSSGESSFVVLRPRASGGGRGQGPPLDQYTQNLNQQAREGRIDPLIGREHEVERVIQGAKAAGARTIRCWSARPASARPRSPRVWPGASPRATCPRCCPRPPSTARHGRAAGGHQVPRRLRAAPEGGAQAAQEQPHAVLFIDEIHTLIGAGARRRAARHGCQQPAQARAERVR